MMNKMLKSDSSLSRFDKVSICVALLHRPDITAPVDWA